MRGTWHAEEARALQELLVLQHLSSRVVQQSRVGPKPLGVGESDHAARITRVIAAFGQIFSETCPASVLKLVEQPASNTVRPLPPAPGCALTL